ncbi:MAG TPA: hypothetical protein G4O18_02430 [Dehalococcoidia bacterium]|nr:hypothetical protein [Dehalococcoidia bacterium]
MVLTIVEDNTGSNEHEADLTEVKVFLEPFDVYLTSTSNEIGEVFSGDTDGDNELDYNETWQWEVTVYPTASTTYTATGQGLWRGTTIITAPDYPEQDSITVEVENGGVEGFTPGFWKNHHGAWELTGYDPDEDYFDDIFGVGSHITLDDALRLKGGKCKALARHAVAALLNAAHSNVSYEFSEGEVINMVYDAFIEGNCEAVKDTLEEQNELEGDISS